MKDFLISLMQTVPVNGWPKKASTEDYIKAVEVYVAALPTNSISGVMQIGGVSHPGISDIDLIVVCNSNLKSKIKYFSSAIAGSEYDHLFVHDPWFVSEANLQDFALLVPFFACTSVYGHVAPPKNQVALGLDREIALLHLSESLITKIPRDLLYSLVLCDGLNARLALVLASSFRYSARLYAKVSGEYWPEADSFSIRIDKMRSNVMDGERDVVSLRELVAESIILSFELVARTQRLWESFVKNQVAWEGRYHGYFDTEISTHWDPDLALAWSMSSRGKMRRSILLPQWSAWHLSLFSLGKSRYAQFISNRTNEIPVVDFSDELLEAARAITRAKSDYISFGIQSLKYAGSLGITHGCGESFALSKGRSILKVFRALKSSFRMI